MSVKTLALFDFDGTLTSRDSSVAFYQFIYKSKTYFFIFNYIICFKELLFFIFNNSNYLPLKKRRLFVHTSKLKDHELRLLVDAFRKKELNNILISSALNRLLWHKSEGHDVWIVSASYDFILDNWAAEMGVNLLTNKTFYDNNSRFLIGKDINFEEKVNAIKKHLTIDEYKEIYAYGDSAGDKQMLEIATYKFYKFFN
jgi:HAD superfamily hydrolase (TIGR01490 family)